MTQEALKLALEALGNTWTEPKSEQYKVEKEAITAIKEALAQPKHEPVAKVVSTAPDRIWLDLGFDPQDEYEVVFRELHDVTWSQDNASGNGIEYVRADTVPPAAQPKQKPMHPKLRKMWEDYFDKYFRAQPEQEPVCPDCKAKVLFECVACSSNNYPPKRPWVGLTEDVLADLWYKQSLDWMEFARAHEAALRSKNA